MYVLWEISSIFIETKWGSVEVNWTNTKLFMRKLLPKFINTVELHRHHIDETFYDINKFISDVHKNADK